MGPRVGEKLEAGKSYENGRWILTSKLLADAHGKCGRDF